MEWLYLIGSATGSLREDFNHMGTQGDPFTWTKLATNQIGQTSEGTCHSCDRSSTKPFEPIM